MCYEWTEPILRRHERMKPIVTDTHDFPTLVGEGYVYVDKTALLRRMISGVDGRFFFMSRPRRFGKSLMISTLEQIFRGDRKLFKGLAISKSDYDWKTYPVIRLDMSVLDSTVGAHGVGHDLFVVIAEQMRAFGFEVPRGVVCDGNDIKAPDSEIADRKRAEVVDESLHNQLTTLNNGRE